MLAGWSIKWVGNNWLVGFFTDYLLNWLIAHQCTALQSTLVRLTRGNEGMWVFLWVCLSQGIK